MLRTFSALALAVAVWLPGVLRAQNRAAEPLPLQVMLQQEPAEFADPFYCAFVTAGEKKFTFIIPQGFQLKDDPATGKLTLGDREGRCSLGLSVMVSASGESEPVTAETCKALIMAAHPNAKILQEFTACVAGQSGPGFDIQWKVGENIYQCQRLAYVPAGFGTLCFSATSARTGFPDAQSNFGLITATFRISSDGKFKPIHISPTS